MLEKLRSIFRYEPDTGRLVHRRTGREITGPYRRNDLRWNIPLCTFEGKKIYASRVIWALQTGSWPDPHLVVDHIDGNPLNNRFNNLQLITRQANSSAKRKSEAAAIALYQLGL